MIGQTTFSCILKGNRKNESDFFIFLKKKEMDFLYLLPPSEWKQSWGEHLSESLSFAFEKPLALAKNASEKDLKCTGKRYTEAITLNTNIEKSQTLPAIQRYDGVMFEAIDYEGLSLGGKRYFDQNFLIFSAMYGLLKAQDRIGNYKLPIETKGIYQFRGDQLLEAILALQATYVVDLLPGAYKKVLNLKKHHDRLANAGILWIEVDFLNQDGEKLAHGVKKVKGERIHQLCEKQVDRLEALDWVLLEGKVIRQLQVKSKG